MENEAKGEPGPMRILVTNAGSSSLKVTCFDSGDMRAVARGMVERIGHASPVLHFRPEGGPPEKRPVSAADAGQALRVLVECLAKAGPGDTDPLGDHRPWWATGWCTAARI